MKTALSLQLDTLIADSLATVRSADRPVGVVGFDVPLDVLLATGRPFCHLPWRAGVATPLADRWLESSFPGWARSILQSWLAGEFDCFASVVFSRGDDAAQRLYYYLCELRRRGFAAGPEPLIFDTAKIPRASSLRHCEHAVLTLLAALDVDSAALAAGIDAANTQRAHYLALDRQRAAAGHLYADIALASLNSVCWPELQQLVLPAAQPARRVLLAGSVPPDAGLHLAVEAAGWNVVGEQHQLSLTRFGAPIAAYSDNPIAAVARHCHAATGGSRDFSDRTASLLQAVGERQADAVVIWLTDEDEVLAWQVARQRAALVAAAIPNLVLIRRRWDCSDGVCDEIRAFLQELSR